MSFKLYTNQEIYDLLNKRANAATPDSSMPTRTPGFWESMGNAFRNIGPNTGSAFEWLTNSKNEELQRWLDIIGNVQDITKYGIQPEALKPFRSAIVNLFESMYYLNEERGNPEAEQQYYNALKNVYTSINPEQLKGNPELAKYFANKFSQIWGESKNYFTNLDTRVRNQQIEFKDPNTGKNISINPSSIPLKAIGIASSQATRTIPMESFIYGINTKVLNGEITPEQGQALIKEETFSRLKANIGKMLSGFEYKNPQQREQSLQEAERLMQDALNNADVAFSDDDFAPFRDKMSTLATRFNVKSFTDKAFARQFGDLSTNPLYKKNPNALYKAYDEYAKLNPGMGLDEFIKEKVYGKDASPFQVYGQLMSDAKNLKGRGYYMGYDPETGEIVYGSGANYTPMGKSTYKGFNRISADKSTYNSLINNANLSNYHQRLRKMRELGFDEEAARDIALRGATKLHTTSWIDGRGSKEGFNPTIRSLKDRVGSDKTIRDLNELRDSSTQNKLDSNIPTPKKPLPNQVTYYR